MKTGLIVEGGGMKCAYSAGVLDIFLDEKVSFQYCMGVSAGAANVASFLAGQRDRNRRFYCIHPKSKDYFGVHSYFKTGDVFGLEYIYDNLSAEGGLDPLGYGEFMKNPAEMVFPATDANTGKPHYFTKQDMKRNNFETIKATCALPVLCRPIPIDGHEYFDGGVSDSLPLKKAIHDGCDKVVIILSKPLGYMMSPQKHRFFYTMDLHQYPHTISALNHRHEMYNKQMEYVKKLEKEGKVYLFAPSPDIKMSTYTMDDATMNQLYENGVADAKAKLKEMKQFLQSDTETEVNA